MSLRRFEYKDRLLPYIPLTLSYAEHTIQREALIDSGATHSLMPYQVGLDFGVIVGRADIELASRRSFQGHSCRGGSGVRDGETLPAASAGVRLVEIGRQPAYLRAYQFLSGV